MIASASTEHLLHDDCSPLRSDTLDGWPQDQRDWLRLPGLLALPSFPVPVSNCESVEPAPQLLMPAPGPYGEEERARDTLARALEQARSTLSQKDWNIFKTKAEEIKDDATEELLHLAMVIGEVAELLGELSLRQ